jgi:hypothetical protein
VDYTSTETGFKIYQWNGSALVLRATVPANTTSFVDTGLTPGTGIRVHGHGYQRRGRSVRIGPDLGPDTTVTGAVFA